MSTVIDNSSRKTTTTRQSVPQRSRSRRERRSDAARKPVLHVVMPGMEVAREEIKPRETIAAFLRRTGWPDERGKRLAPEASLDGVVGA
jgi:hypothetical protein